MKKLVLFLHIILGCFVCYSQKTLKPNKTVTFDFSTPIYPAPFKIKPRQSVELVLQNINPYLYDVTINDSLVVYGNNQPASFTERFKMPELNSVPATAPPSTPSVNGAMPVAGSASKIAKDKEASLQDKLEAFVSGYSGKENNVRDVLKYSTISDDLNKLLNDCYSTMPQLISKAQDFITDKISVQANTLPLGIQAEINNNSSSARRDIEQYISTGEALKKEFSNILEASNITNVADYKSIEKNIREKIAIIDKVLENCKKLTGKLTAFDDGKVGLAIEEAYNKVLTSRIEKRVIKLTRYNTDEVLLNVTVKKKKDIYCKQEINSFPVNGIVTGGVKIDFSTGLVFNIGNHKFFDQKYHYDSVYRNGATLADSVTITRNRNNNILLPSLGAFFHVYSRFTSHINIGGMLGASLGTDQRLYYNVGGCLLIGKSDRLIIGFGMSVAQATTLDGQYSEGQIFKRSLAPQTIPTEKASRVGGYFSLSWNLNLIK